MSTSGVRFPGDSTSATAREVVAEALRDVDAVGARAVENETNWRRGYLAHFTRLVEAGIGSPEAAVAIAEAGLQAATERFRFDDVPLSKATDSARVTQAFHTRTIEGGAEPETELTIPYRGERLRGRRLTDQLDAWVANGVITASCAQAVTRVQQNPEWLRLEGDTVAVLGAGAEMGPYRALLRWGAEVVALDLPRHDIQERIREHAESGAGRVHLPARIVIDDASEAGADIVHELPAIAQWLEGIDGRLVLGNYCYADGGTHVLVSMAADALGTHVRQRRPDTALAFLATPTDVFAVHGAEVVTANDRYSHGSRFLRTPLRVVSGGRLLQRNYPPRADMGICDALVPQQGPNYAFAKRLQRWRATSARHDGALVSLNVAPATRTRSVIKNKALAAAYAGAHRFGVEVFDPATSNVLMAALLVHDLRAGETPQAEPWMDEAQNAAHGGLWTAAYHPRSALGLAAVLGVGALRG
ncbi:hypothetical protein BHE97_07120 [Aeromicrobium sp. PE09-221]|uniref:hypothetical protein n=1 Tax=Aeromicrobium sp. PE09-221 TaxID=1898043 RepID=UPI000B3ECFA7|nr:hypothetical protein [Aeromicrobium sp. PE09-221]OUZ10522.1 hypothetical protein BHE97_07120 [Aeromicrobium sp. PE09-221]